MGLLFRLVDVGKVRSPRSGVTRSTAGSDTGWRTGDDVQLLDSINDSWNNLYGRAAYPYGQHRLVVELDIVVPIGTVDADALKVIESSDVRPLSFVEIAAAVDKKSA